MRSADEPYMGRVCSNYPMQAEQTCQCVAFSVGVHLFVNRRFVDIYGGQGMLYMPVASALAPETCGSGLSAEAAQASAP